MNQITVKTQSGTAAFDPKATFKVGPVNRGAESSRWRNATDAPTAVVRLLISHP
jgi:hypothetical protein